MDARRVVIERARDRCEKCGHLIDAYDFSVHHRRPRGMGGSKDPATNMPSNLMLLCGSGTTGCHGWVESNRSDALLMGFLVSQGHAPGNRAVLYRGTHWAFLEDDGRVHFTEGSPKDAA
jgi:hypothetical protein